MSKRITSGSSKASSASDEAFGRLKNWAERIDEEIARLESEARRKMMTCSFDDKNGLPAPICDTIRDNVEEMSQMVQAMVRALLAVRAVEYRKNTALQPFFFSLCRNARLEIEGRSCDRKLERPSTYTTKCVKTTEKFPIMLRKTILKCACSQFSFVLTLYISIGTLCITVSTVCNSQKMMSDLWPMS